MKTLLSERLQNYTRTKKRTLIKESLVKTFDASNDGDKDIGTT